jgi:erythromycin esterase-like protein
VANTAFEKTQHFLLQHLLSSMEQQAIENLIKENVTRLPPTGDSSFGSIFDDFGSYKVVLIGTATHGTHEFYDARAKITQHLIEKYGFNIVAIEADWPDAEIIDRHVRRRPGPKVETQSAFDRFPRWLWRNQEVHDFVEWLREHNKDLPKQRQAGFYGLDLYNLGSSMEAVIDYLAKSDPEMGKLARQRYGKVQPWLQHIEDKPENIRAMVAATEGEVVSMLRDLLKKRLDGTQREDTEDFHSTEQNARLAAGMKRL